MPNARPRTGPPSPAFSFVEVILGLVIMALLAGITITFYEEDSVRSREDLTRARLANVADGLKRWELEKRRDYPHAGLGPLVGQYIDSVGLDPWGNPIAVDLGRGFVYSWGPNIRDDRGDGDDIRFPFRSQRITQAGASLSGGREGATTDVSVARLAVAPSPPRNLRFELATRRLLWSPPGTFSDGSPLTTATQLAGYRLYETTKGADIFRVAINSPTAVEHPLTLPEGVKVNLIHTLRAFYIDQRGKTIESAPSNQAGVYVPEKVGPEITSFDASDYSPPVGNKDKKFAFKFEVFDADSNLSSVTIEIPGLGNFEAWPPAGKTAEEQPNRFQVTNQGYQPARGFTLATTAVYNGVALVAVDKDAKSDRFLLKAPIKVSNNPPDILSFRSDRGAIIRGSNPPTFKTTLSVSVDVSDREDNLSQVLLFLGAAQLGAPSTVGSMSRTFVVDTNGSDVTVQVEARDTSGAITRQPMVISISKDETPPETASASLNASNDYLTGHPVRCETLESKALGVNNWYVTDARNITGTWTSFEAETPPVHYKIAVASTPPSSWTTAFLGTDGKEVVYTDPATGIKYQAANASGSKPAVPGAVTANPVTKNRGWVSPNPDTAESYGFSADREELSTPLAEGIRYYMGVQAFNSANPPIYNRTFANPRNPLNGCLQNGFALDKTPPTVGAIFENPLSRCKVSIPISGGSTLGPPISGANGLGARWPNAQDNLSGSGLSSYSFSLVSKSPNGQPASLYNVADYQATEINNLPIGNQNGNTLSLSVRAKDVAGNISSRAETLTVLVDGSFAQAIKAPLITNLTAGVLTDPNNFEADWSGVFVDPESGASLAFEWGISTVKPIKGIPDRSPGGWLKPVPESSTQASLQDTNLLANGDTVYLVVRATNCANATSPETYSAPALVRTDIFSRLTATPLIGFKDLTVDFKLEVVGGKPPFDFSFKFSDKASDPSTLSVNGVQPTSVSAQHVYTSLGSHRCLGQVLTGTGSKSFALATIQVLPQPYALVLGNGSLSVLDLAATPPTLLKMNLAPAGVKAGRIKLIEVSDVVKFALLTAAGAGAVTGGFYRFDIDSADTPRVAAEETGDAFDDIAVSTDFLTVLGSNLRGKERSLLRARLDPVFNFKFVGDSYTPFSMAIGDPLAAAGAPSGVAITPDNSTGIACNREGPVMDSVFGLGSTPRISAASPMAATTPGYFRLTAGGAQIVVTDRGSGKLFVGTLAKSGDDTKLTTATQIDLGGMRSNDLELGADKKTAFVTEFNGARIARVDLSAGKTLQTSAFATGIVAGLDISRDGSLLLAGDSAGAVQILEAATLKLRKSVPVTDGCRDVAFFERPAFGKPVVTRLVPASAQANTFVEARGFNLGPTNDGKLKVTLVADAGTPPTTDAVVDLAPPTNGFSTVRFRVPPGYPLGQTSVFVATSQGTSASTAGSKLTIKP